MFSGKRAIKNLKILMTSGHINIINFTVVKRGIFQDSNGASSAESDPEDQWSWLVKVMEEAKKKGQNVSNPLMVFSFIKMIVRTLQVALSENKYLQRSLIRDAYNRGGLYQLSP